MGFFDTLFNKMNEKNSERSGAIAGGKQKQDGDHDHRTNTGGNRTPAQKEGDKKNGKAK